MKKAHYFSYVLNKMQISKKRMLQFFFFVFPFIRTSCTVPYSYEIGDESKIHAYTPIHQYISSDKIPLRIFLLLRPFIIATVYKTVWVCAFYSVSVNWCVLLLFTYCIHLSGNTSSVQASPLQCTEVFFIHEWKNRRIKKNSEKIKLIQRSKKKKDKTSKLN